MTNFPRKKRPRKKKDLLLKKQKARAILERHQAAKRICDAGWGLVNMEAIRPILKTDPFKHKDQAGPYDKDAIRFISDWKPKMMESGLTEEKADLWMQVFRRILSDFPDDGMKLLWLHRKPKRLSKNMRLMLPSIMAGMPILSMAYKIYKNFGFQPSGAMSDAGGSQ